MAAVLAALILSIFAAGGGWLLVGSRLRLDPDERANDLLNLGAYVGIAFVPALVLVFLFSGY
jgi:hypothetical protein